MNEVRTEGWAWSAFFLGPVWYLMNGPAKKGLWLLFLCLISFGLAIPFVCVYSGACARADWYDFQLSTRSRIRPDLLD